MNTGRGVLRTWWLAVALLLVGVGLILPAQAQEKAPAVQQTGEPTQPQAAPQDPDPARAARRAQRQKLYLCSFIGSKPPHFAILYESPKYSSA